MASKGEEAFKALARILALTWGISVRKSKLIYSAVVRPIITYGAQIWATQPDGSTITPTKITPIQKVQNKCLRKILGTYKRTLVKALEKECEIPPLDLHIDSLALQWAIKVRDHPITEEIRKNTYKLWTEARKRNSQ